MLKHTFKQNGVNHFELLHEVNTFSKFSKNLRFQAKTQTVMSEAEYLNAGFQSFVEFLIKSHAYTSAVNILNYQPVEDNIYGLHGVGEHRGGKVKSKVMVHIQYVNPSEKREKNAYMNTVRASTFVTTSLSHHRDEEVQLVLFSNENDVFDRTKTELFHDRLYTFNKEKIRKLVDANIGFWVNFRDEITKQEDDFYEA